MEGLSTGGTLGSTPGTRGFTLRSPSDLCFGGGSSLREDQAGATEARREMAGPRLGTHVTDIEKSGGLGKDGHRDEARV